MLQRKAKGSHIYNSLTFDHGSCPAKIAQALERAGLEGEERAYEASAVAHCLFCFYKWPLDPDMGADDYRHKQEDDERGIQLKRCDSQIEQHGLAAIRKRLEELPK